MTSDEKKNTLISCVEMALIYCACLYGLYLYTGKLDLDVFFLALLCMSFVFMVILLVHNVIWRKKNGIEIWAKLDTELQTVKNRMCLIM